jgi:hypothetical protein
MHIALVCDRKQIPGDGAADAPFTVSGERLSIGAAELIAQSPTNWLTSSRVAAEDSNTLRQERLPYVSRVSAKASDITKLGDLRHITSSCCERRMATGGARS